MYTLPKDATPKIARPYSEAWFCMINFKSVLLQIQSTMLSLQRLTKKSPLKITLFDDYK